ncbi:phage tail protein [Pseudomonas khavaziana]|uniref:phage tail protein n=1 Tax=Pseudomonas khavaziana TaxID=2842351 RepID=UPI001C3C3CD1|nr:phage tail protein [Pseudomonas khavaziana]MBV4482643.1 phage tail protein [Pseudomonas khavaziana]
MTADTKAKIAEVYPLVSHRFKVKLGKGKLEGRFSSVSGLEVGVELVKYQNGMGERFQQPGQEGFPTITLKRGIVPKQSELCEWMEGVVLGQFDKQDLDISLLDAKDNVKVTWTVKNAFPTKLTGPSMDATGNEVAFEELTLAGDAVSVHYAS